MERMIYKAKKRAKALFFVDQTDKPCSVECGNLSTLIVADKLKPPLLVIRRADVKITSTNRRCIG